MAKSPAAAGLALAAAGIAGGLAYDELNKILENVEKQAGKTGNAVTNGLNTGSGPRTAAPAKNRTQEIGKELQGQLNAVNSLADGYRRAAQANMDRYTLEVEMLGKSREEQDIIKGTADINKRYDDQRAALEEKRKGAKGQTLALIKTEIANLGRFFAIRLRMPANASNSLPSKSSFMWVILSFINIESASTTTTSLPESKF